VWRAESGSGLSIIAGVRRVQCVSMHGTVRAGFSDLRENITFSPLS